MLHRARQLFIRQQTAVINSIRAYLAEFGIVAPVGCRGVEHLLEVVADTSDRRLTDEARACLAALGSQLRALKAQILEFDRRVPKLDWLIARTKRLAKMGDRGFSKIRKAKQCLIRYFAHLPHGLQAGCK
jgi:transposase